MNNIPTGRARANRALRGALRKGREETRKREKKSRFRIARSKSQNEYETHLFFDLRVSRRELPFWVLDIFGSKSTSVSLARTTSALTTDHSSHLSPERNSTTHPPEDS